jgi:hypothetical protein
LAAIYGLSFYGLAFVEKDFDDGNGDYAERCDFGTEAKYP